MALAARFGQAFLAVPLGIALPLLLASRLVAEGTAFTFYEERRFEVLRTQRLAAGMAKRVAAGLQSVRDRDPPVEHEALALPEALGLRHVFEILQDPALQVEDIFHPG